MQGIVIHAPRDLRVESLPDQALGADEVRVRIGVGGICGSDLHYFNHGGMGAIRLREPMVLGHEISGNINAVGAAVTRVKTGQRVAVNPSRACGACGHCRDGLAMHCDNMLFIGSAMRFPHVQGGFRQELVVHESQAIAIPDHLSAGEAAMAEPLAVCLHALARAGAVTGKRILITGCGPIGLLVAAACRHAGAMEIIATDVADFPVQLAARMGADAAFNVAGQPDALDAHVAVAGPFDIVFEAAGAPLAIRKALSVLRPRGTLLQIGLGGDVSLPMNVLVAREIELRGSFRFHKEFATAVALLAKGRIDAKPLITATLPFGRANEAFLLACDRSRAAKVQLDFASAA